MKKPEILVAVSAGTLACGLPVVASDWPGPSDVVVHNVTGLLAGPHDSSAFADHIERLEKDPHLGLQMGSAGKERFLRVYTLDSYRENIHSALIGIMQSKQD